jgi:hypothetical protein
VRGLHHPAVWAGWQLSANLSEPHTNPEGIAPQQCVFCSFRERFACERHAKPSPQTVILPTLLNKPNPETEGQPAGLAALGGGIGASSPLSPLS